MAKEKTSFQRWYERNKDSINQNRRTKYKADPEFREQAKRSTSAAYRAKPFVSKAGQGRVKVIAGVTVMTYPIREVASYVDRSVQTIRLWEARGWIPSPTVTAGKRFYTAAQKELLLELSALIDSRKGLTALAYGIALDTAVKSIKSRWFLI